MAKQKQYKLKFKPTPISRLLKRSKLPMKMVGYPHASNWDRYYHLNYEFVLKEAKEWREEILKRKAAAIEYGEGPFVEAWSAA